LHGYDEISDYEGTIMINADALNIAELLQKATYVIDVYEDKDAYDRNESYNSGSGVVINSSCDLITAGQLHCTNSNPHSAWQQVTQTVR
jgi:hypothetical protein